MSASHAPAMSVEQVTAFLDAEFPQIHHGGRSFTVLAVGNKGARLRCAYAPQHLRPGGTLSGPTMMTLADLALYVAILGEIGPVALAVTTSINVNFLRKPAPVALIAECSLLKLGRRLAVGEVAIRSEGRDEIVCHATGTYAIPSA